MIKVSERNLGYRQRDEGNSTNQLKMWKRNERWNRIKVGKEKRITILQEGSFFWNCTPTVLTGCGSICHIKLFSRVVNS